MTPGDVVVWVAANFSEIWAGLIVIACLGSLSCGVLVGQVLTR